MKPLVKKCVDCRNHLSFNSRRNKHHFRCDKCWLKYMADGDKHKLQIREQEK